MSDERSGDPRRSFVVEALSSIGGVAALSLGFLYLAGIVLKAVELREAGLSVSYALKLFPLEHILRAGLTLVLPALLTLAALGAVLLASWRYERWMVKLAAGFRAQEAPYQPEDTREQWSSRLEAAETQTKWGPIGRAVNRALWAAWRTHDKARRRRLWPLKWALMGWTAYSLALFVFIGAFCFLLPPEFAVPTAILLALAALLPTRPVEQELAIWYAIVLVALVGNSLVFPRPPATVSLVTDNEGELSGDLVLVADSTWYVSVGRDAIRAVPSDHVECVRIVARPRRSTVLDHLRNQPAPPPEAELKCKRSPASRSEQPRSGRRKPSGITRGR